MAGRFEWRRTSERQLAKHEQLGRQGRPRGHVTVDLAAAARIEGLRAEGLSYARIAALVTCPLSSGRARRRLQLVLHSTRVA